MCVMLFKNLKYIFKMLYQLSPQLKTSSTRLLIFKGNANSDKENFYGKEKKLINVLTAFFHFL